MKSSKNNCLQKSLLSQCSSVKQGHQRDQPQTWRETPLSCFATFQSHVFSSLFFSCFTVSPVICPHSRFLQLSSIPSVSSLIFPTSLLSSLLYSNILPTFHLSFLPSFLPAFLPLFVTYSCQVQWQTVFRSDSGLTHTWARTYRMDPCDTQVLQPLHNLRHTKEQTRMVAECACVRGLRGVVFLLNLSAPVHLPRAEDPG